jgi:hypothetical protein
MDIAELRERQAPLKELYSEQPKTAIVPLTATATWADPRMTTTVDTWAGPVRSGQHPALGGFDGDACSADMLLEAVLACAGTTLRVVALAMRSTDSPRSPSAASSSDSPTSSSAAGTTTKSLASATTTTAPAASTSRCHTSQLSAAFVDTQGAAGSSIGTFRLTNNSSNTCTVTGFPGLALTDDAGRDVVPPPRRETGSPAEPVELTPGAHAVFLLQWGNDVNGTGCFIASRVVITPPDETDPITIPAVDANGTRVTPCGNGATFVQPVRAE